MVETVSLKKVREKQAAETAKAFGGCTNCYGKGYATQIRNIHAAADFESDEAFSQPLFPYVACTCDRGKQIQKMWDIEEVFMYRMMRDMLPIFADEEYPKGKTNDRGEAITHIAQYIVWVKQKRAVQSGNGTTRPRRRKVR